MVVEDYDDGASAGNGGVKVMVMVAYDDNVVFWWCC